MMCMGSVDMGEAVETELTRERVYLGSQLALVLLGDLQLGVVTRRP